MVTLNIRISEETHETIKKISLEEQRSINKEINFVLNQYIKEYEKEKDLGLNPGL